MEYDIQDIANELSEIINEIRPRLKDKTLTDRAILNRIHPEARSMYGIVTISFRNDNEMIEEKLSGVSYMFSDLEDPYMFFKQTSLYLAGQQEIQEALTITD